MDIEKILGWVSKVEMIVILIKIINRVLMNERMSCMFLIPDIKNGLYIFIFNINEENLHNFDVVVGCSHLI